MMSGNHTGAKPVKPLSKELMLNYHF